MRRRRGGVRKTLSVIVHGVIGQGRPGHRNRGGRRDRHEDLPEIGAPGDFEPVQEHGQAWALGIPSPLPVPNDTEIVPVVRHPLQREVFPLRRDEGIYPQGVVGSRP